MHHRIARAAFAAATVLAAPLAVALPEDRNQPIKLEAGRGQLDQKTGVSVYEGNVVISQGSMRLTADTATIYVKDNSFQKMDATGNPATLRYQPAADKPEIQGASKRVEYDVGSGKVVLTGGVRVVQGQDTFNGERLEYDLKDDVIRAKGAGQNGRIQFTIQPKAQNPTPAPKKP
ncbi:MAG TPA: lipopolysaccharide transport periplasmic protein LptA [Candidatus Competibacter sp.]|nr:lipopolysaccharide transport periplasmic protein LptA [Candidatus Competibacteraceae bacterium]HRC71140.1 lipopolysaccharide transport periplasmic protein LptA [Candidatus Competibacter sp.]